MKERQMQDATSPSKLLTYIFAICTVFLTISIIQYPKETFDSAILGLNLWWNVVFPSLLPFFILSEVLMGIGIVNALGVLLEPLMRPIFNVPGVGAFALSMGLASGYPMDAVITCKFRKNRLCSEVEAERLLAFTNTADPLFMFGAVAVGMFAMPELGAILALSHYISSFLIGILYRFHGRNRDSYNANPQANKGNLFLRAFRELYLSRKKDCRSFGQLLGDAVRSSMNTILLIGGFIMLFSVCLRILSVVGIIDYLNAVFSIFLSTAGFHDSLAQAMSIGLFEIDLGALAASQAAAPLNEKLAIAGAIIAWSGLSVHGQVASIAIEAGVNMLPYMISRFIHAALSAIFILLFMGPWHFITELFTLPSIFISTNVYSLVSWLVRLEHIVYQFALLLCIMVCLSIALHFFRRLFALRPVSSYKRK